MRVWLVLVFGAISCASAPPVAVSPAVSPSGVVSPAPIVISPEEKSYLDKKHAEDKLRAELLQTPDHFVTSDYWEKRDSGIVNDYTRATAIRVKNRSEFDVSELKGKIHFSDKFGQEMATVPFTASGEVPAGQTVKLNIDSSEISGKAVGAKVVIENLRARR